MSITLYHGTNRRIEGDSLVTGEQGVVFASRSKRVAEDYAVGGEALVDWDNPYAAIVTITLSDDAVIETVQAEGHTGPSDAVAAIRERGNVPDVLLIDWTIEDTGFRQKHDVIFTPSAIASIDIDDWTDELTN